MPPPPFLTLNEFAEFTYLVNFLNSIVPPGTVVLRGQQNRTAEPKAANFVVAWPINMQRLGTNQVDQFDNIITASIAGSIMTVLELNQLEGVGLQPGMPVTDGTLGLVNGSTQITSQLSGQPGGTGTYGVTPAQTLGSQLMYVGAREDMVPTEWIVQCDCHGPNSANVAQTLFGLFRSEYGTTSFEVAQNHPPWGAVVEPLYSDEARYIPFLNGEKQYEYRWTVDVHAQVNPTIITYQDFADELKPDTQLPADLIPPAQVVPVADQDADEPPTF